MDLTPALREKFTDPLWLMLGAMAVNPKLSSLLLYDITPYGLKQLSELLSSFLSITTTDQKIEVVRLDSTDSEETLWGQLGLTSEANKGFRWQPGSLNQCEAPEVLKIVIIPDLAMLSLAATRACVMAMGADVVQLERHGETQTWQPNVYWLIGCSSKKEELGKVSNHLMDRIALRLTVQTPVNINRESQLRRLLELSSDNRPSDISLQISELEPDVEQWLQEIIQAEQATVVEKAWERAIAYTPTDSLYHRREINLIRLAIAYGQLLGEETITVETVDKAAEMLGFESISLDQKQTPEEFDRPQETDDQPDIDEVEDKSKDIGDRPSVPVPKLPTQKPEPETKKEDVFQSEEERKDEEVAFPSVQAVKQAYLEDQAPPNREKHALRLPIRQFKSKTVARGIIIGTERTQHPQDLAIVRTILEAAKFKKIRQLRDPQYGDRLKIYPTDLFRYRRAPVAEQMLMLVMDYTCLDYSKWEDKLYPYISWAYTQRATVGLVQVGVKTDDDGELRAKKLLAKSVLVPAFESGLNLKDIKMTKATPLAHGLDLALTMMRHSLQHGSSTVSKALCVVVSDGRGNIPLSASQQGKITFPVGAKGVEDALAVAKKIGKLDNVDSVWLNPQPKQCQDLPLQMAVEMKAKVVALEPLKKQGAKK